ncbi:MAG: DNA translocase FtsK 4TM domain-containing protein, partial [Patescibacteria group bacterium]
MPRKKRPSKDAESEGGMPSFKLTSRETSNTILGIFSIVVSLFLLLGAFGLGGRVGALTFDLLTYLSGVGYYLLPIVFLLLAVSLIHEREREFALPQILGSILLFLSSLGFVNLVSEKGGVIGGLISNPLVSLFDIYVSALILLALTAIAILVIFDISLRVDLGHIYRKLFSKEVPGIETAAESLAVNKAIEKIAERAEENTPRMASAGNANRSKKEEDVFSPIVIRKSGKVWTPPPLSLLERDSGKPGVGDIKANANLIKRTLLNFGIMVEMD